MENKTNQVISLVRSYDLFIIISLLWFMIQFIRYMFPPLFETFQEVYSVSNTATGLLFTLLLLAYALAQFPAGLLGDKFGHSNIIFASAILFSSATLLVAFSPVYILIVIAAMAIGFGTGPHKTVAIPMLARRYPENTGRVLGIMDTFGQFGGMAAPLIVAFFIGVTIWQSAFVFAAGISGLLVIFYYTIMDKNSISNYEKSTEISKTQNKDGINKYKVIISNRKLIIFVLVTICYTFTWNAISSFLPLYLTTEKEFSPGLAGGLYSVLFVMSISQPITGEFADRIGSLNVGAYLFIILILGLVFLISSNSFIAIGIATVLIGLGVHGFRPVRDSYLMKLIPDSIAGGGLGLIRTFMTGIGALAPVSVGFLSDTIGFMMALLFLTCIPIIAFVLIMSLKYSVLHKAG